MTKEEIHDQAMEMLLKSESAVQRGKGVLMQVGVLRAFWKAIPEGKKAGIGPADMKVAGVHILASLLVGLAGPNLIAQLLLYDEFCRIYKDMSLSILEADPDADPE